MPKENLRDKLDGNELDLSLNNLSVVPVKDLAALPKATRLDLSCNSISSLPPAFCTLSHLVKIDLSKNDLTELPDNFGQLANLAHLDLLGNKLSILPLNFWQCRKLKWLDLKDNPLKDELKRVAGDCLDEAQCKACAKNVLEYMKSINSAIEREKQRRLREEREFEEAQKALDEKENKRKRELKKKLKEQRKKERELEQQAALAQNKMYEEKPTDVTESNGKHPHLETTKENLGSSSSCFGFTLKVALFVNLLAIVLGIVLRKQVDPYWQQYVQPSWNQYVQPTWDQYGSPIWSKYGDPYWKDYGRPLIESSSDKVSFAWSIVQQKSQDGYDYMKSLLDFDSSDSRTTVPSDDKQTGRASAQENQQNRNSKQKTTKTNG